LPTAPLVEERGLRSHRDQFFDRAREGEVDGDIAIQGDRDIGLLDGGEAAERCPEVVVARVEVEEPILALFVSDSLPGGA
jgi:hypothetical protein